MIKEKILQILSEIEKREHVQIFFACESGSRGWGFPSQDSDYDVRFLYLRPPSWYLSIQKRRDVIERPIDAVLDISGWDLHKALQLLWKSNTALLEWLQAPIIYQEKYTLMEPLRAMAPDYFSPAGCLHHFRNMAKRNVQDASLKEIDLKKFFYVIRPVLAFQWLQKEWGPAPMDMHIMATRLLAGTSLLPELMALIEKKRHSNEHDQVQVPTALRAYVQHHYASMLETEITYGQHSGSLEALDTFFRNALKKVWGDEIE
jgi:hypothetical protein